MYRITITDENIAGSFSAKLEYVDKLCRQVLDTLIKRNLSRVAFAAQLVLREALNNAVIHGCGSDPRKQVECQFAIDKFAIQIAIKDEGQGFNWRANMKKSRDDEACSGRGLHIMQKYATRMSFNDKGNQLFLKIDL